jgi:hypothetical protein
MCKKTQVLVCTFTLILFSCQFSKNHHDRESDKIKAENVTNQLFNNLKVADFDKANKLFSKNFFSKRSKALPTTYLKKVHKKCGALVKTKLWHWNTVVSETNLELNLYTLEYNATFEKCDNTIIMALKTEPDGTLKITGYRVVLNRYIEP